MRRACDEVDEEAAAAAARVSALLQEHQAERSALLQTRHTREVAQDELQCVTTLSFAYVNE